MSERVRNRTERVLVTMVVGECVAPEHDFWPETSVLFVGEIFRHHFSADFCNVQLIMQNLSNGLLYIINHIDNHSYTQSPIFSYDVICFRQFLRSTDNPHVVRRRRDNDI